MATAYEDVSRDPGSSPWRSERSWRSEPVLGSLWLLGTVANRWLQAAVILRVLGDPEWKRGTLLYPLRDLLGSLLWANSYLGQNFYYRGKIYRLMEGGVVEGPDEAQLL